MSWTILPDLFIDEENLNVYELACAVLINRKTQGWGKAKDGISNSQFSKSLSISKNTVIKSLKSLEEKGIILIEPAVNSNGSQSYNYYSFTQKVMDSANNGAVSGVHDVNGGVHLMNWGSAGDEQGGVHDVNTQEQTITKQTKQDNNPSDETPEAEEGKKLVAAKKPKPMSDDKNEKIAEHMLKKLRADNPKLKVNISAWSEEIRKMRALDDLDAKLIVQVFNWANADEFWSTNIRSPQKLRKQFDTLLVKMNSIKSLGSKNSVGTLEDYRKQGERILAARRARQ